MFDAFKHASLPSKLSAATAVIMVASCLSMSWFFIAREINSMEEELIGVGRLISHNMAETSRHPLVAGDRERLSRLIEGAMTSDRVAYVLILSGDGRLLGYGGKDEWRAFLEDPARAEQLVALNPAAANAPTAPRQPLIIELSSSGLNVSAGGHPAICWLRLMSRDSHPFVVHLTEPIRPAVDQEEYDPVLSLTLSETPEDSRMTAAAAADRRPPYGYILLGMSGAQDHSALRAIAWQVLAITGLVIAFSLGAILTLTKRMTGPLKDLTKFADRIAGGDLSGAVAPRSQDEVGQLATAFNHMATRLQSREQELLELNKSLESRVEARTLELQRANQELTKLSNLKTALVSNASHELRTPLTSIKVHVKNLVDGVNGALQSEQLSPLRRVLDNADRLGSLIGDLLDLSKLQTLTPEIRRDEVATGALLTDVIDSLRYYSEQKSLAISCSFSADLPALVGDRDKLWRLFTNVLHNAIKFTPAGGRITVNANPEPDGTMLFAVQDTGPGIPLDEREKIFLPFFRSQDRAPRIRGTGLGLSIARELVRLHGGSIWMDEAIGGGSCFYIRLPSARHLATVSAHSAERGTT